MNPLTSCSQHTVMDAPDGFFLHRREAHVHQFRLTVCYVYTHYIYLEFSTFCFECFSFCFVLLCRCVVMAIYKKKGEFSSDECDKKMAYSIYTDTVGMYQRYWTQYFTNMHNIYILFTFLRNRTLL